MYEIRALSESELANAARWVGNLRRELDRLAPSVGGVETNSRHYLEKLDWIQHEGFALDRRALECDAVSAVLLLLAEHLQVTRNFSLQICSGVLIMGHERFVGCVPLEMLAYRPLQPDEGGEWLNEDDPIDRALASVELLDNAISVVRATVDGRPLEWLRVLLGDRWLGLMRPPMPRKKP